MPPRYDNIADAYPMVRDGKWHTISMTTRDATWETNEEAELGASTEGTWLRFDLSDLDSGGDQVELTLYVKKTEGDSKVFDGNPSTPSTWRPDIGVFADYSDPDDPQFDPENPNFNDSTGPFDSYIPDLPVNPQLSSHFLGDDSLPYFFYRTLLFAPGLTYYLRFDASSFPMPTPVLYGTADVSYAVNWTSKLSDITVDRHADTSSPAAGTVREDQIAGYPYDFTSPYVDWIGARYTFRVQEDELPLPGRYWVTIEAKEIGSTDSVYCTIRRNGFPLGIVILGKVFLGFGSYPLPSSDFEERRLTDIGVPFGGYTDDAVAISTLPVLNGDIYEFAFFNAFENTPIEFDLRNLRWYPIEMGGKPGRPIRFVDVPEMPLGATDYTDLPDISHINHAGDEPYNNVDFVVLDDERVFLMFHAEAGAGAADIVNMVKYEGGTWSLVTNDPFGVGGGGLLPQFFDQVGGISQWHMATDGTDIWVAYGIVTDDDYMGSGESVGEIRIRKYTVGSNTWSDVGSGITPEPSSTHAIQSGTYDQGKPQISISPDGVPWVTFASNNPALSGVSAGSGWSSRVWAFYWDGADWVDSQLPQPVNPYGVTELIDVHIVGDYPRHAVFHTYANRSGPSDNPSAVFIAYYDSPDWPESDPLAEWYYTEYNGSTWSNPENFLLSDLYPPGAEFTFRDGEDATSESELWTQGVGYSHNESGPILCASLGGSSSFIGGVLIAHMVDGEWQPYYSRPSVLPNRPLDGVYLWVDPGGAELAVMDNGDPFVVMDSNLFGWTNTPILQPRETGTGDLQAWGVKTRTIPLSSDVDMPPRLVAKGNVLYYANAMELDTVDSVDLSGLNPFLAVWRMPLSQELHLPWEPLGGIGTIKYP